MPNRITNRPIMPQVYNHWGLISNNLQCKNIVRQPGGRLWAAVSPGPSQIRLLMSEDNGFTWQNMITNVSDVTDTRLVADTNADGPMITLTISEQWDNLDVFYVEYFSGTDTYDLICGRYSLSDVIANPQEATDANNITGETTGIIEEDIYQGLYDVAMNDQETFVFFDLSNQIVVRRISPRSSAVSSKVTLSTTPVFNIFSTTVNANSVCAVLFSHQTGGENIVKYVSYDETNGWGTPVTIENFGGTDNEMRDPSIAYDGYGNLCALYTDTDTTGSGDTTITYAISTDSGATWDVNDLSRTEGHAAYYDLATGDPSGRTQVIGASDGGFLILYTESADTTDYVAKTYVRHITTDDGSTYTLGGEKEIATNSSKSTDDITGAHFFLPATHARLMDFRDPGLVRVAFNIGDGAATAQDDITPSTFGQELLFSSAYSSVLDTDTEVYTIDTPDSDSVLVSFNILGGPNENVDYYTLGVTGDFTDRYIRAFDHIGNTMRLLRYEPDIDNWMNDRSAFGDPTEYSSKCIFSPQSYGFPAPEIAPDGFTSYVEQDARIIYLPPDIHLARTFQVNKGGYLKRTVWLCQFDGNEYELSQVVPYFIRNQICYYTANAYVVGPSRDPFARDVLPSET